MISTTRTLRALAALVAFSVAAATPAAAQLNFDDITTNASGVNNTRFNTPYNGFSFENFSVGGPGLIGTGSNAASGTKFALGQPFDNSFIYREDNVAFDFTGAFLSFRAFDAITAPVMITVNAYRGAGVDPVFSRMVALTNNAELFAFDFFNVDEIEFDTEVLGLNRSSALAVDNLNISAVPEPSTVVLMSLGMAGLLVVVRRKRGLRR